MTRLPKEKGKKNDKASSSEDAEGVQQNSVFGKYSEAEVIARIKELALDPGRPNFSQDNIQPLRNQILRLREVMMLKDSKVPWRKRKLEQFVKDKIRHPPCFAVPNPPNRTKMSRRQSSHASSVSCLLNSVDSTKCQDEKILVDSRSSSSMLTSDGHFPEKQVSTECSFLDDVECWELPNKDASATIDSDESVYGSNPLTPENPTPNEPPSVDIDHAVHGLNLETLDGSQSPSTADRIVIVGGYRVQKNVIPVGPRFQADVPEWSGPPNRSVHIGAYDKDPNNSRWLGTRVWPIEVGNRKTAGRAIGKGRPDSCHCASPGSVDCIRRHILENRILLQCELGPAFFVWKFDEMGEQVSKSWTMKEQQTLESLVTIRSSTNGKNFLNRVLKCFPNKCRKDIVNYYFNVYIPKRMSLQLKLSSIEQIDTDDEDDMENFNYMGVQKRSGEKNLVSSNPKIVRPRYQRKAS